MRARCLWLRPKPLAVGSAVLNTAVAANHMTSKHTSEVKTKKELSDKLADDIQSNQALWHSTTGLESQRKGMEGEGQAEALAANEVPLLPSADESPLEKDIDVVAKSMIAKHADPLAALWKVLTDSSIKGPEAAMAIVSDPRCGLEGKTMESIVLPQLDGKGKDCKIYAGATPIELAARAGRSDVVAALAAAGASVPKVLITYAIDSGDCLTIESAIDLVKLTGEEKKQDDSLCTAAKEGLTPVIELLASKGWSVEGVKDYYTERIPLHDAAENGHLAAVQTLLRLGGDINRTRCGRLAYYTALHLAAKAGHVEVVKYLVDKGADKEIKDWNRKTPLHWAAETGQAAVVECLIEKGADKEARDFVQQTPLHLAVQDKANDTAVIRALITNGAEVNAVNEWNKSPLCLAVKSGYDDAIEVLLKAGTIIDGGALFAAQEKPYIFDRLVCAVHQSWAFRSKPYFSR